MGFCPCRASHEITEKEESPSNLSDPNANIATIVSQSNKCRNVKHVTLSLFLCLIAVFKRRPSGLPDVRVSLHARLRERELPPRQLLPRLGLLQHVGVDNRAARRAKDTGVQRFKHNATGDHSIRDFKSALKSS